jgi:hypothetical protein
MVSLADFVLVVVVVALSFSFAGESQSEWWWVGGPTYCYWYRLSRLLSATYELRNVSLLDTVMMDMVFIFMVMVMGDGEWNKQTDRIFEQTDRILSKRIVL